jgi:hypothetical protein
MRSWEHWLICFLMALSILLAVAALDASASEARPFGFVEAEHLSFAPSYFQAVPPCVAAELRIDTPELVEQVTGDPFVLGYADLYTVDEWRSAARLCKMVLSTNTTEEDYYFRCVVTLHEYGHWLLLDHHPDPRNLMYESIGGTLPNIPQCKRGERARRQGCRRKRSDRARERCRERWALE